MVAVEASRTNYEQIQKMIECNGLRNVRLVYGAVYSVDGEELRLHSQYNYDKRGEVSVGNTVHPDWTRKDGSHPAGLSSNASSFNTVSSVTVDALVERFALKRVDAIFCTINGIEMDALIGASKTLARYRPDVALADRYRQRAAAAQRLQRGWRRRSPRQPPSVASSGTVCLPCAPCSVGRPLRVTTQISIWVPLRSGRQADQFASDAA